MKYSLKQHIKQVFEALNIDAKYDVYASCEDVLPDWLHGIELTHEFVICCDASFAKDNLQLFIHKDIFQIDNHYFWFDGERIEDKNHIDAINVESSNNKPQVNLKAKTRLSSWLDNFIFNISHAEYAPDFQKFEYNLNLRHEDNLKYLGTYFPRSYAEAFCIFDNLFCNETIKTKYARLTEVSILSVGCGTGGDIMGLLTVLNKHFPLIKKINIFAIDGNEDALNILSQIVSQASNHLHKEVFVTTKKVVFDEIRAIDAIPSFDFIMTSKFINEIINRGEGRYNNSYYDFARAYSPFLKEDGVMMILDVTTKVGTSDFCPILLNKQVNQFVCENSDFTSIIPIPCTERNNCQAHCFSQKEFIVSHSKAANDKSRVAYRILVRKSFAQGLVLNQEDTQYQIQPDRYCGQGTLIADGFYLPNTVSIHNEGVSRKEQNGKNLAQSQPISKIEEVDESKKTIETKPAITHLQNLGEAYLIDTNAFIYAPNIIDKIAENYPIFVSAKVVDELDHRKDITSGIDKKKVQKALKSINIAISSGRVQATTSDARLLPADFDRRSPDNLILSVALKLRKKGYSPIIVTSDNGFQAKAKTLEIKTIPYTKIKIKL